MKAMLNIVFHGLKIISWHTYEWYLALGDILVKYFVLNTYMIVNATTNKIKDRVELIIKNSDTPLSRIYLIL